MEVYVVEIVEMLGNKINDRYVLSVHSSYDSVKEMYLYGMDGYTPEYGKPFKVVNNEILNEEYLDGIDKYMNIIPMVLLD